MSRPQRDSWLASLPQGASLIAVSTHPLNVSITGMLKPMDARGKRVLRKKKIIIIFYLFIFIFYFLFFYPAAPSWTASTASKASPWRVP